MQILNIFHVLVAIAMVAFILVQRGPGATAGAAFGSGASGTVFGARGAGSFLSRSTWVLAVLFCLISLTMAVLVSHQLGQPEAEDLGVVSAPAAIEEPVSAPGLDLPAADDPGAENNLSRPVDQDEPADDLPAIDGAGADEDSATEDGSGP